MRDKIIESIYFQFTFNLLQMTQTQEIINHMVSKFMNGYAGMCMSRGKFSKLGKVRGKFIESIFVQLLQMAQTQKIITYMVLTF